MPQALLALGSNLGDRASLLHRALAELDTLPHTQRLQHSSFHETAPVGGPSGQGAFLNAAALIDTQLPPATLHDQLLAIESRLGRQRLLRWSARSLDLDLLLYDQLVFASPTLIVPHPRIPFRRFVLAPADEIAPHWRHPRLGLTLRQLLAHLDGGSGRVVLQADAPRLLTPLLEQLVRAGHHLAHTPHPPDPHSQTPHLPPPHDDLAHCRSRWRQHRQATLYPLPATPSATPPTQPLLWVHLHDPSEHAAASHTPSAPAAPNPASVSAPHDCPTLEIPAASTASLAAEIQATLLGMH